MARTLEEIVERARQPVAPLQTAAQKKAEKATREDSAGPAWFNMPAAKMTPELQAELRVLRMRGVIDPKRHYKSEKPATSKYLQVGTIIDDATDFYSARTNRTSRRAQQRSLVDTLLRDEESRQYFKSRFNQLQRASQSGSHKAYQERRNRVRKPWNSGARTAGK